MQRDGDGPSCTGACPAFATTSKNACPCFTGSRSPVGWAWIRYEGYSAPVRLGEARFDSTPFDEWDPSHRSDGAHADPRIAISARENRQSTDREEKN